MTPPQDQFIQHVTRVFEAQGAQRILGLLLGALLIHPKGQMNAQELQDSLHVSRAAISQGCTTLTQMGFIEKVRVKGDRKSDYRLREGVWEKVAMQGVQKLQMFIEVADFGLQLAPNDRLSDMKAFFEFWQEAYPRILQEWQSRKGQP
ncbi:GbsR/MarR family transcriptional regulator [Deinococcus roseus]|uniref:HTH marR-type domain-containing protein n=1 Tax=Deinococcus roseus TaxID=392414 RepID=A0ABQ2CTQ0_9DEIO|nr:MarR family transcriptional regulator [Deinococcus roseus]GGJ19881.1 hypothetical protein GCM10008938_02570 [Deinococcus roseus]